MNTCRLDELLTLFSAFCTLFEESPRSRWLRLILFVRVEQFGVASDVRIAAVHQCFTNPASTVETALVLAKQAPESRGGTPASRSARPPTAVARNSGS